MYAIAYATTVAFGQDPTKVTFHQPSMLHEQEDAPFSMQQNLVRQSDIIHSTL